VAHAPQGQKGSPSSVQAPPTFCLVDSPIPGRRPHPGRVRAPLPPRRQEENTIRVPEPGSDTARLEYNSGAQSDGVGDGALLARRPMVPPARISPVQHGGDTAPGRSAAVEPKEALIASLGMGLSDALREAESKNGVPPAASFARRLSKGTQERYNSGWRRLGDMVRESPRILQEIADDIPQAEILTKLLSTLQASEPSPRIILANTNKAYRRAHPSVAKNDTIPDRKEGLGHGAGMAAQAVPQILRHKIGYPRVGKATPVRRGRNTKESRLAPERWRPDVRKGIHNYGDPGIYGEDQPAHGYQI